MKNFITFEGGECSGKTTVINYIKEEFDKRGIKYITTREPGGIKISEKIRDILLDKENTSMTGETEALLYAASRIQHLKEKVLPALENGYVVICDRFLDSSLVYQGYARGLGIDNVLCANLFAQKYLPDLTLYLDSRPEIALKRLNNKDREGKKDRLDSEGLLFHQKVYDGYHEILKMYPDRIKLIDSERNIEEVKKDCLKEILNYLGE